MTGNRLFLITIFVFSAQWVLAGKPVFFTGTSLGVDVSSPTGGETLLDAYAGGELSVGLRDLLPQDGFYSITSRIEAAIHNDLHFSDSEFLSLELRFRNWSAEAGLLSALIDDGSGSSYINPNWMVSKRTGLLSNNSDITFEYAGYLTILPAAAEDLLYQGFQAAIRTDPSVFLGYGFQIGGGWEYHYEQLVYLSSGDPSGAKRHDLVLDAVGAVDGILGYFTGWSLSTNVTWRKSNAAYAVRENVFLEHPEDRLQAALDASIYTSPHQSWRIDSEVYADGTWYPSRPARDLEGAYGDEDLLLLDLGISAKVDWTPNQRVYLALSGGFGYTISNDPYVGGWSANTAFTCTF